MIVLFRDALGSLGAHRAHPGVRHARGVGKQPRRGLQFNRSGRYTNDGNPNIKDQEQDAVHSLRPNMRLSVTVRNGEIIQIGRADHT